MPYIPTHCPLHFLDMDALSEDLSLLRIQGNKKKLQGMSGRWVSPIKIWQIFSNYLRRIKSANVDLDLLEKTIHSIILTCCLIYVVQNKIPVYLFWLVLTSSTPSYMDATYVSCTYITTKNSRRFRHKLGLVRYDKSDKNS